MSMPQEGLFNLNNSRATLLSRFLTTAFPTFRDAAMPTLANAAVVFSEITVMKRP